MTNDPTPETLQDRTRLLRDHIAKNPHSAWVPPPFDVPPQLDAVMLTVLDYVHHLETRLAQLEEALAPKAPVVIPHENLSEYKTSQESDPALGPGVVVMLLHQSDPALNGKWTITGEDPERYFDCAENALAALSAKQP